jgi:hypothetical protein
MKLTKKERLDELKEEKCICKVDKKTLEVSKCNIEFHNVFLKEYKDYCQSIIDNINANLFTVADGGSK